MAKATLDLAHEGDDTAKVLGVVLLCGNLSGYIFQILVRGGSSSGKTSFMDAIKVFFPSTILQEFTNMTPPTLIQIKKLMKGATILYVKELDGLGDQANVVQILKMFSADDRGGRCVKMGGAQWKKIMEFEIPSNITLITTYAKEGISEELGPRNWIIEVEQNPTHIKRVLYEKILQDKVHQKRDQLEFTNRTTLWKDQVVPRLPRTPPTCHDSFFASAERNDS